MGGEVASRIEVASRLVLRLDPEKAEIIFDMALNYYRDDRFDHVFLAPPLHRLLKRNWETFLLDQRIQRVLNLLSAPIVGLDNFGISSGNDNPDLGRLINDGSPVPCRTADNEEQWKRIVDLAVRGLSLGNEARKRAAYRIAFVALWGRLTEPESVEIARSLWGFRHVGDTCLPVETNLADVEFLELPEPEPGLAEQCFRKKWLSVNNLQQDNEASLSEVLWQIGNVISRLKHRGRSLHMTEDEKNCLVEFTGRWVDMPVPRPPFPFFEDQNQEFARRSIIGLRAILPEISLPDSMVRKLYGKIRDLNESETPGFTLMAGIIRFLPDHFDEIVQSMRVGLVSDESTLAEDAAWGLFYWMKMSNVSDAPCPKPPIDLVREIGVIIASRRSASLDIALQITKWIFEEGSEKQKTAVSELAIQGLDYLLEELRYDRRHERDEDSIPSLRRRCVQLAVSMAQRGFEETPVVSRWLKDAESDPMPEVRYAKVRHAAAFGGDRDGNASGNGEEVETETE